MAATYPETTRFYFVDQISDLDRALLECFGVEFGNGGIMQPPANAKLVAEVLGEETLTVYWIDGLDFRIEENAAYSRVTINYLPEVLDSTLYSPEDRILMDIPFEELRAQVHADTRWLQEQQRLHNVAEEDIIDDYLPDDYDPLLYSEELES